MKNRVIRIVAVSAALMLILGLALAEVRTTGDVWLRTGPGRDYDAISILSTGKTFDYLGESSVDERGVAWYKIIAGDKTGWVSSRYSELIGESTEAEDEAEVDEEAEATPTEAPASKDALLAGWLFGGASGAEPEPETEAEPEAVPEPEPEAEPAPDAPVEAPPEAADETSVPAKGPARTVELSTYYLNNLVEAANEIGLISYRQVESEAPYQYYDNALILAGNRQVENIVVYGPGYEVYGVSVGMDVNAARACLNAAGLDYVESLNGVTYEHRSTEASLFTDPNGHDSCINVWVDENGAVTEIDWSTYTG